MKKSIQLSAELTKKNQWIVFELRLRDILQREFLAPFIVLLCFPDIMRVKKSKTAKASIFPAKSIINGRWRHSKEGK